MIELWVLSLGVSVIWAGFGIWHAHNKRWDRAAFCIATAAFVKP